MQDRGSIIYPLQVLLHWNIFIKLFIFIVKLFSKLTLFWKTNVIKNLNSRIIIEVRKNDFSNKAKEDCDDEENEDISIDTFSQQTMEKPTILEL